MYTIRGIFYILQSILIILFIGDIQGDATRCKKNSEYMCNGIEFQCPDTKPENQEVCKCFCNGGYWRDGNGNCVKECPCPPGKVWREGNSCFDQCNNRFCPQYLMWGCWNEKTCT
ncbi:uncharacterized protein LOC115883380 [Sitophilus oryzae]|uniref:Uncharacterized protein LOC115883380 n=1 Tax=Sitophilus oryzae TaxID=7048 RepID=A0A6J2Y2W4_SITOR|nr:uncharacterized protein LOC115883380 [Sitophilus oryzae]